MSELEFLSILPDCLFSDMAVVGVAGKTEGKRCVICSRGVEALGRKIEASTPLLPP